MSTEYRGKVKQPVWLRAHCLDDADPDQLRRLARRDFKRHAREEDREREREERVLDVASPDMIAEASELA